MGGRVGWCSWVVFLTALGCTASGIRPGAGGGGGGAAGGVGSGGAEGEGTGGVAGGVPGDDNGGGGSAGMAGPTDGPMCGVKKFSLATVPPDLMIVLDKSGSMRDRPDNTQCDQGTCGPASKWAQMTTAINQVVTSTENAIRWGIEFFPADDSCAVETMPAAPITDLNAAGVAMAMAATAPSGATPTRAAINAASFYAATLPDLNPRYILLATDGFPTCMEGAADHNTADAPGTIQAVTDSAARGIPVFVVGIGMIPQATATLTAMAIAGGQPQTADPRFYPASSTADLVSVLRKIGGMLGSCSFALGSRPPDPNNIGVVADGAKIPQDITHTDGWDYGTGQMSLQLFGQWCDDAKAGKLKDVEAIFGCPGIVIP